MDPRKQKRKEDFLRNYKNFRRQAREYTKAHQFEASPHRLLIEFEVDRVQYEIELTLNLL